MLNRCLICVQTLYLFENFGILRNLEKQTRGGARKTHFILRVPLANSLFCEIVGGDSHQVGDYPPPTISQKSVYVRGTHKINAGWCTQAVATKGGGRPFKQLALQHYRGILTRHVADAMADIYIYIYIYIYRENPLFKFYQCC